MQPQQAVTEPTPKPSIGTTIKNMSTKKKISLIFGIVVLIIGAIALFTYDRQTGGAITRVFKGSKIERNNTANLPRGVVAKVGDVEIPEKYLEHELSFFPSSPTEEQKVGLVEKLTNDHITLEKGKEEGYITDFPSGANLSQDEYLVRTQKVEEVKQKVNRSGNMIKGRLVSVWFYNNAYVGPKGLAEGKKIAYAKIKPLYDKVAAGTMTVEQAGQSIADDASLLEIDLAYKGNAISSFTFYEGGTGTFWPQFNDIIWNTEQGKITPLYLGGGILRNGVSTEELYIFAKIDEKSVSDNFNNYEDWLEEKKTQNPATISNDISLNSFSIIPEALAQDGPDNGGNSSNSDNGGNSSNGGDNPDNTMRSGSWSGYVKTQTGAGIPGVQAHITTSCNAPDGRRMTTDGNGYFSTGVDTSLACVCTPHVLTAYVPNMVCDKHTFQAVGNPVADINQDIICRPPPPPPPAPTPTPTPRPPINRCNQDCTTDTYCADAEDGCTRCLPSAGGGKTCQPPPPPVQCNDACVNDEFCSNQANGCTSCLPSLTNPNQKTCQPPAKCGSSCNTSEYCVAAENGCTSCIKDGSGAGKCGTCPPGMVYDSTTMKCGCPNPNETNPHKICDGDKCLDVAACGISTCGDDKACFAEEMCKCDGFDSTQLQYPSTNPFVFEAFAKVEGTDMSKAAVQGINFIMYESDKNNPNSARPIAQSPMYTPEIVSSTASKVRYKATWSLTPPEVKAGKLYRVQAKIKCVPKKKSTLADLPTNQYQSKILGLVKSANAQESPAPSPTPDQLQLTTLNFVQKRSVDKCSIMEFELSQGVGTNQ